MTLAALVLSAALHAGAAPGGADPSARLAAANALLAAGDAEGAARGYEALRAEGLESAALHANLGTAHLRAGRRGAAVASYLRALRLDPRDADTRADLALARGPERLAAPERSFLARVVERTPDGWAAAAFAVPWAALFAVLATRRRARGRARSALSAAALLAALAAAAGGALLVARAAERRVEVAVVIAAETPVRAGPEEALRPIFSLHEGSEVSLLEVRGGAARVRLANGLEGWVALATLERV